MRVFFGIEPGQEAALAISDWRDRQFGPCGRPVSVANLHMTLAFGGELPNTAVDSLCDATDHWVDGSDIPAVTLELDQTGYWQVPGIYWLGPSRWPPALEAQVRKLRQLLVGAGARRERRSFQPHVTLFRNCDPAPPMPAQTPAITLRQREIALFESRRLRGSVAYHVLAAWLLPAGD
ncbi:MAG: RNA 2',3'-cyclic phosphodiesterase [Parahaliea sp.]